MSRKSLLALAVGVAPLLLWVVLILLTPTDWARRRLTEELAESTGQDVRIGSVSLSLLGRLQVRDLAIASRATPEDPWIQASSAGLDVHLLQMICGWSEPAEVQLDGVHLRVKRREDGTFELADLIKRRPSKRSASGESSEDDETCPGVHLRIQDAQMTLIDDKAGSRFEVTNVEGKVTWSRHAVIVDQINGRLNGGTFEFAARCDRSLPQPRFEAETRVRGVSLAGGVQGLGYLMPVIGASESPIDGQLHLRLTLRGDGFDGESLRKSLEGHGSIAIDPVNLEASRLVHEVEALCRLPDVERIGSVQSNFLISENRVSSEDLTIKLAGIPLVLSGWTDFDGRVDYVAHTELTQQRIPKTARSLLAEIDLKIDELSGLRIEGTLEHLKVSVDRGNVATKADRLLKDKEKLNQLRDKLLDQVLR